MNHAKLYAMDCGRDQMYRIRGRFIAYTYNKNITDMISRNKLRRGRDTSGPYHNPLTSFYQTA